MSRRVHITFTSLILALALVLVSNGIQAAASSRQLTDVPGHWAEEAINALVKMGVVQGYPDGTFKPEDPVTRGEFSKMVASTFGYAPGIKADYYDAAGHWAEPFIAGLSKSEILKGYPDGTFKPSKEVTRAEMAAVLSRVAGLGVIKSDMTGEWTPGYRDIATNHWAFVPVEIARRLDVVPLHFGLVYEPDRSATRAETAYMVRAMAEAEFARGQVTSVSRTSATVSVKNVAGNNQVLQLSPDAVVYRNGVVSDIESIRTNDSVYAVGDSYGESRFVIAEGTVTKEDITKKISALTDGVVSPEQVDALSRGKWDEARKGMTPALAARLEEMGLTQDEASALLAQDWQRLPELGQRRLATALGTELGVAPELIEAVMARDWTAARNYAELQAAEILLSRFLQMK